jgi:hypothetical protein
MNSIALAILFPAAFIGFIATNWRWKIGGLAVQYLILFLMVAQVWPLGLAAVKWIAGWMSCAILAFTKANSATEISDQQKPSNGNTFKILASIMVGIVVIAIAPKLADWSNAISVPQAVGGLLLIGMGLISAALSARVLAAIIALLSIFAGFELIYSAVEISTLLAGLLALINLGIAMVGSYLILLPTLGKTK